MIKFRLTSLFLGIALLFLHPTTGYSTSSDTDVFSSQVPPNVLLTVDSSGSMRFIIEHPAFDQASFVPDPGCDFPAGSSAINDNDYQDESEPPLGVKIRHSNNNGTIFDITSESEGWVPTPATHDHPKNGYIERTYCGQVRRIYSDGRNEVENNDKTQYTRTYLRFLFGLDPSDTITTYNGYTAQEIIDDIDDASNGRNFVTGDYFGKFHLTRITVSKDIARDVIYQTNTDCPAYLDDCGEYEDRVRFGVARFTPGGARGGFVAEKIDTYTNNRTKLETAIQSLDTQGATPLAESLFKLYTYFMSRTASDRPFGKDGSTRFPPYMYRESNGKFTTTLSDVPPDPVVEACQNNFVIFMTDGSPVQDDFAGNGSAWNGYPNRETLGFEQFRDELIGDFAVDSPTDLDINPSPNHPEEGEPNWLSTGTAYLDDVAKFMSERDFRLDLDGEQTIDTYTVGFAITEPNTTALLKKTAVNGKGLFFSGSQAEDITDALVNSIQDIISKSQGFSAATVPASRTSSGGNLYSTLFQPTSARPFWPGELRSYEFTGEGNVLDRNSNCAFTNSDDPTMCTDGTFRNANASPPIWSASRAMPGANQRNLKVSLRSGSSQFVATLDHGVSESDLGGLLGDISDYPPSPNVASNGDLDEAIVSYVAGCEWGTGLTSDGTDDFAGCVDRTRFENRISVPDRLGDIFHSNPVVVGPPPGFVPEVSYQDFARTYARRDRLIIAGANDGFLHGFLAAAADPITGVYDERRLGAGTEQFAFMPWGARSKIMNLAKSAAAAHPITVDGSPSVADVWIDRNTDATDPRIVSEWHTVAVTGLREGGEHYFALDLTNPEASDYPQYMWEFPTETDADIDWRARIGETWSKPVITRVRLEEGTGDIREVWVAIVGYGYHPTSDPNDVARYDEDSLKGRGIMMIEIDSGRPIAVRQFGNDPGEVSDMTYAIPSRPGVLDYDNDGFADLIYVGDLGGNVWKWVIRTPGTANPSSAALHQPNWSFRKFFSSNPDTSLPTSARARSFFFAPSVTRSNGIMHLGFGSGERKNLNCSSTLGGCTLRNRFYVVKDRDVWDSGLPATIDGRADPTGDLTDVTALQATCPAVSSHGYFFEVSDGEKFVTNSEIFNSFFFASTFRPVLDDNCEPSGASLLYGFLAKCGQGFFGPPSPLSPVAGTNRTLDIGTGIPTDPRISLSPSENGNRLIISKQDGELINIDSGRANNEHGTLYWRELN